MPEISKCPTCGHTSVGGPLTPREFWDLHPELKTVEAKEVHPDLEPLALRIEVLDREYQEVTEAWMESAGSDEVTIGAVLEARNELGERLSAARAKYHSTAREIAGREQLAYMAEIQARAEAEERDRIEARRALAVEGRNFVRRRRLSRSR